MTRPQAKLWGTVGRKACRGTPNNLYKQIGRLVHAILIGNVPEISIQLPETNWRELIILLKWGSSCDLVSHQEKGALFMLSHYIVLNVHKNKIRVVKAAMNCRAW